MKFSDFFFQTRKYNIFDGILNFNVTWHVMRLNKYMGFQEQNIVNSIRFIKSQYQNWKSP